MLHHCKGEGIGPQIEIKCCGCKNLYSDPQAGLWCDIIHKGWEFHGSYKTPVECPFLRKIKLKTLRTQ